jgi:hypothetical protein
MSAALRHRADEAVHLLGAWLYPATSFRHRSAAERRIQFRAGVVGAACIVIWITAAALSVGHVLMTPGDLGLSDPGSAVQSLGVAVALVAVSVFAPNAIFRTRNAARTRALLSSPSAPIPPWHASTITIDAVLVGGMIAGLAFDPWLMLALMSLAMIVRLLGTTRRRLPSDANARFHVLTEIVTAGAIAASAFVIVAPLAPSASSTRSPLPMVLAGIVAMLVGVAFNAVQRWVSAVQVPWGLTRDLTDTRRLLVALTCAGLAWLVAWTDAVLGTPVPGATSMGSAGLLVMVVGWLALCCGSILLWRRDAARTLALWQQHQAQIVMRLADGSLHPELARRAALPTAARMAVSVFGATRAMAVIDDGHGDVSSTLVTADRYDTSPTIDASALDISPHLHLHCIPSPVMSNSTGVTVAAWLWPGWFVTRSSALVQEFTALAGITLLTPTVALADSGEPSSFDAMFDSVHRWPTLMAFSHAMERMRARADASPHSDSLIVGVYAIDDFGALSGGRFEQAAVAQVVRLALGHEEFTGHDVFVAYEAPGRIWVALAGGPLIRNGISLLRGLQQRINDHGAVPAQHADIDVHVSVSFGHAAHQVDDFTQDGLMGTALARLATDADARNPFAVESLLTYNIRPEDIIGEPEPPMTTIDMLDQLRSRADSESLLLEVLPIVDAAAQEPRALLCSVGWNRTLGNVDLSSAEAFAMLVNRQSDLAAAATDIALDHLVTVMDEADACGLHDMMIMAALPSVLLHPDAGHLALPNLMSPRLDRRQCSRTVVLVDMIPLGAGQALRVLADRGISIAVTASAAAGADASDLFGWQRWAIVFPQSLLQGTTGPDSLTIQQTVTAIASTGTRLIGQVDRHADARELLRHGIAFTMEPDHSCPDVHGVMAGMSSRATELN